MDNVIDNTIYPLPEQKKEALKKRRMGLGVTGLANALELCGLHYGSEDFIKLTKKIMRTLRDECYRASTALAAEKGPFQYYSDKYLDSPYIKRLPKDIQEAIKKYGIRNSHLISIAPTGTISFCADNISSGIEPVFSLQYDRTVQTELGPVVVPLRDYAYEKYGLEGTTTDSLSTDDHLNVLLAVQEYTDSAVSKTINVGSEVTFNEFKNIYTKAWKGKAKGCTTFRLAGKRYGILNMSSGDKSEGGSTDGAACFFDPETGEKSCS